MPDMRRLILHRMPALNNIARPPWIKGNIWKREHAPAVNPNPEPPPAPPPAVPVP